LGDSPSLSSRCSRGVDAIDKLTGVHGGHSMLLNRRKGKLPAFD
jgi:hypothetical protein